MTRCRRLRREGDDSLKKYRRSFDLLGSERNVNLIVNYNCVAALNPWKRKRYPVPREKRAHVLPEVMNPLRASFSCYNVNSGLDAYVKRAVLKVSPSVVSLISYSAGKQVFWCSGLIFGSYWKNHTLRYYVLTSATLLRPPASHAADLKFHPTHRKPPVQSEDGHCIPIDKKIDVYLRGGRLCKGTVVTYDPHYNIAVLTFKSEDRLPCAVLRPLDDSPIDAQPSTSHFPYPALKIIPGDAVIAVARSMNKPFEIMAAPGRYRVDCFDEKTKVNCVEVFAADSKITKCGIGGPLISCEGEVIGINFYSEHSTPFLPINIFLKWWTHHKVTRTHCRPSLGMKVANLHTADPRTLDQVQKLGISQGLIVEKVLAGSPAESCDLRPGDVVFKCSDTIVVSPLQLFDIIWDMTGKTVEVAVVREGSYKNMNIEVKDITLADEFYQWPLPRKYQKGREFPGC